MSHQHHDLFENRKQFQIERLILFSDAVFAIAITLLIIEIRVPEIVMHPGVNKSTELANRLLEMFPQFFAFILSFAVIGQFWTNHHRLFGLISNYNLRLLWLNLHMLFWIVLVPFTSGLNAQNGELNLVWEIYSFNLFMIALSLYFLYRYIGNPKNGLSELADDPINRRYSRYRSMVTSVIFLSGALIAGLFTGTIAFWTARMIYFLIPIAIMVVNRRLKKALKKAGKPHSVHT